VNKIYLNIILSKLFHVRLLSIGTNYTLNFG